MTPRIARARTIVALGAAGLALSACGGGGATPGVAIEVGDEEISTNRVDEAAVNYCTAVLDQLKAESASVSMGFVRQSVVGLLTLRAQTLQIADEYGVEPGSTYGNDVAERTRLAASMPEEVRDDYVELATAESLFYDVRDQVGRLQLEEDGVAEPTVEQVSQAGADVFRVWPDSNGVRINPRYGLENVDGVLTPVDSNLSVAVSDDAQAGLNAGPDDVAYARTLPATHRCG